MTNYDEIARQALELQKAMIGNPAYADKTLQEITTEAIGAAEDIHTVLEGHRQLAEILKQAAQQHSSQGSRNIGVISWLFGRDDTLPDHLG